MALCLLATASAYTIEEQYELLKQLPESTAVPQSVPFDKLDLAGDFLQRALGEMHAHNHEFMEESAYEIENYFDLEMVQIMFDHNLRFKEFIFIFEDFWKNAEPHGERLERNINEVQDIREKLIKEFVTKLDSK